MILAPKNGLDTKMHKLSRVLMLAIVILVVLRFLLVVPVFQHPERFLTIDSGGYIALANGLIDDGRYYSPEYPKDDTMRPPGYPVFLVFIFAFSNDHPGIVAVVQVIISGMITGLLIVLGRKADARIAGLIAALLYLLSLNSAYWSLSVMSEILFSLEILVALFLAFNAYNKTGTKGWIWVGIILGLATLTRPVGLYLIFLWAAVVFFSEVQELGIGNALKHALVLLVMAWGIVLVWQTRNLIVRDQFVFSRSGGVTFTSYIVADTLAEAKGISRDEAKAEIYTQQDPRRYSYEILFSNFPAFLRVTIRGTLRTLLGIEPGTWAKGMFDVPYNSSGLLTKLMRGDLAGVLDALRTRFGNLKELPAIAMLTWGIAYSIVLLSGALIGTLQELRHNSLLPTCLTLLLIVTPLYLIFIPLGNGDARFRVPAEPYLALLAGIGISHLLERFSIRRHEEGHQFPKVQKLKP